MFCQKCGAEIKQGARFCGVCGSLASVNEPAQFNAYAQNQVPYAAQQPIGQRAAKPKKKKTAVIAAVIAAVVVIAGVGVAAFLTNGFGLLPSNKVFAKSAVVMQGPSDNDVYSNTTFNLNGNGNCTQASITSSGNTITVSYERDVNGYLTKSTSSDGVTAVFNNDVDANGKLLSSTMTVEGLNSKVLSTWLGTWDLIEMNDNGTITSQDDLELIKEMGYEINVKLNADGTAAFDLMGEKMNGTWEPYGSTYGSITIQGETIDMEISKGKLVMSNNGTSLTFKKRSGTDKYNVADYTYVVKATYSYYADSDNISGVTYSVSGNADPTLTNLQVLKLYWDNQFPYLAENSNYTSGCSVSFSEDGQVLSGNNSAPSRKDRANQSITILDDGSSKIQCTYDGDGNATIIEYFYDNELEEKTKTSWIEVKTPSKAMSILGRLYI